MMNDFLYRFVDPRTVKLTPEARLVVGRIVKVSEEIAENRRQFTKGTMDFGEDHFFTQRDHLSAFFKLVGERSTLSKRFAALERRAILVQFGRNLLGMHKA